MLIKHTNPMEINYRKSLQGEHIKKKKKGKGGVQASFKTELSEEMNFGKD